MKTKIKLYNNMDWYVIEYLYPRSFNKFVGVMFPNTGLLSVHILKEFNIRKLYGFFDSVGIYLNIEVFNNSWSYTISLKNGRVFCPRQDNMSNRVDSEICGFNECFRILEEQLTFFS